MCGSECPMTRPEVWNCPRSQQDQTLKAALSERWRSSLTRSISCFAFADGGEERGTCFTAVSGIGLDGPRHWFMAKVNKKSCFCSSWPSFLFIPLKPLFSLMCLCPLVYMHIILYLIWVLFGLLTCNYTNSNCPFVALLIRFYFFLYFSCSLCFYPHLQPSIHPGILPLTQSVRSSAPAPLCQLATNSASLRGGQV